MQNYGELWGIMEDDVTLPVSICRRDGEANSHLIKFSISITGKLKTRNNPVTPP